MFVNAGANFVVPDFNNVVEAGGDLMAMANQVRRAVVWAYENVRSYGGDPDRFYVSGHSSGGHWVGCCSRPTGRKTLACRQRSSREPLPALASLT
jgi:acetyl esterase/lipase